MPGADANGPDWLLAAANLVDIDPKLGSWREVARACSSRADLEAAVLASRGEGEQKLPQEAQVTRWTLDQDVVAIEPIDCEFALASCVLDKQCFGGVTASGAVRVLLR